MEERNVSVGQRTGAPDDPADCAALGMACLADADVLVLGDGSAGVPASRAAADCAAREVVQVCRASPARRAKLLVVEALASAHRAVVKLGRENASSHRLAAACVVAHIPHAGADGTATVARAGRAVAFRVRAGVAESVFSESSRGRDPELGPTPLGLDAGAPPEPELEIVSLGAGDRLVLATLAVPTSVGPLALARTAWSKEPQIAANQLVDQARRQGGSSVGVQILRRESSGLADAMDLLQPTRQREMGRWQDEKRSGRRREAQRRLTGAALWGISLVAVVAIVVAWVSTGKLEPRSPASTAAIAAIATEPPDAGPEIAEIPPVVSSPNATVPAGTAFPPPPPRDARIERRPVSVSSEISPARAPDEVATEALTSASSPPSSATHVRNSKPPDTAPAAPPLAPHAETPAEHAAETSSVPANLREAKLDAIFAQPPDDAARALRRFIINDYAKIGEQVFAVLDRYVDRHPGRDTVVILVALFDRRPPPKTRSWLRDTLPRLLAE